MKALITYNRVAQYLGKIFDLLNEKYFENSLSKPMITIQSTPGRYGHYTTYDAWEIDGETGIREININADTLSRPIEELVATLVHEMVHYDLDMKGIKDTSRAGKYHNQKFRDRALECDLLVFEVERYGWARTLPSDDLIKFCIDNGLQEIRISRIATAQKKGKKKKSSTRKYVCPKCGAIVRATKEVRITCTDCNELFVLNN